MVHVELVVDLLIQTQTQTLYSVKILFRDSYSIQELVWIGLFSLNDMDVKTPNYKQLHRFHVPLTY